MAGRQPISVQVWKLRGNRALTLQPEAASADSCGGVRYTIPALDLEHYDRLALIIVRLDANERADPQGSYRLSLDATPVSAAD